MHFQYFFFFSSSFINFIISVEPHTYCGYLQGHFSDQVAPNISHKLNITEQYYYLDNREVPTSGCPLY